MACAVDAGHFLFHSLYSVYQAAQNSRRSIFAFDSDTYAIWGLTAFGWGGLWKFRRRSLRM